MRKNRIAGVVGLVAATMITAAPAIAVGPPDGKGGAAQEQCEKQKDRVSDEDCDY